MMFNTLKHYGLNLHLDYISFKAVIIMYFSIDRRSLNFTFLAKIKVFIKLFKLLFDTKYIITDSYTVKQHLFDLRGG